MSSDPKTKSFELLVAFTLVATIDYSPSPMQIVGCFMLGCLTGWPLILLCGSFLVNNIAYLPAVNL